MADPARVFAASEQERDRITPAARKALWGSALGYAMDGFDLLILGFMLRAISADLGLSPAQAASLVTATLVGAVIGGVGFGMLSDRLGPRGFSTGGMLVTALSFVLLELLPVDFGYPAFAALLLLNGVGMGLFSSPNRAEVMNSLPAGARGARRSAPRSS